MFNLIKETINEITEEDELVEDLVDIGKSLAKSQIPLDTDTVEVLAENLWDILTEE